MRPATIEGRGILTPNTTTCDGSAEEEEEAEERRDATEETEAEVEGDGAVGREWE